MDNDTILKQRIKEFDKIEGPRVGDFLLYKDRYVQFSHEHEKSMQTTDGGSFYLGNGYIEYSGGLNHGVDKKDLVQRIKHKKGKIWFFDKDIAGAGRGVYFDIKFRVFKVIDESKVEDIHILGIDLEEERLKKTKEVISRLNGNGQEYVTHVPTLIILQKLEKYSIKNIKDNTGLDFKEYGNCWKAQPQTSNQILRLLVTYNLKCQYHNGSYYNNTLLLKLCSDSDFKM